MSQFPDERIFLVGQKYVQEIMKVLANKKVAKRKKGDSFLKGAITESAWAASRTKDTSFNAYYH
jgi:hypothetical protein